MTIVWTVSNRLLLFAASIIMIGVAVWWITSVVNRLANQTNPSGALSGSISLDAEASPGY